MSIRTFEKVICDRCEKEDIYSKEVNGELIIPNHTKLEKIGWRIAEHYRCSGLRPDLCPECNIESKQIANSMKLDRLTEEIREKIDEASRLEKEISRNKGKK